MSTLPSPRHLVASLISSISTTNANDPGTTTASTGNPLKGASPSTQKALLTLHVLFPNELLPALDLLDRGLITRFVLAQPEQPSAEASQPTGVYYIRSAQQQASHHQRRAAIASQTPSYEVRLNSWSCSCPAFAFAAFPADSPAAPTVSATLPDQHFVKNGDVDWSFGGLTLGTDMPVCKHLLAGVLIERCEIFSSFVEEQEVSVEELAAWAAGWGD